ncbi:MAG: hypothetical protein U0T32_12930 [Chitinophagales bacterium]
MKTDSCFQFYTHYFSGSHRVVEIHTVNNQIIKGVIVGFIKGDTRSGAPFITQWHVVDEAKQYSIGIDPFGCVIGDIVDHQTIKSITMQDGQVFTF